MLSTGTGDGVGAEVRSLRSGSSNDASSSSHSTSCCSSSTDDPCSSLSSLPLSNPLLHLHSSNSSRLPDFHSSSSSELLRTVRRRSHDGSSFGSLDGLS